jgi:hypothetical protein
MRSVPDKQLTLRIRPKWVSAKTAKEPRHLLFPDGPSEPNGAEINGLLEHYWPNSLGFFVAMGTLFFSAVYGLLGLIGWLALNLLLGYKRNQARKQSRPDAYDDRLTDEKMQKYQEDLIASWQKKNEDKEG